MGHLQGLRDYLDEKYHVSIFDQALKSKETWEFRVHGHQILQGKISKNMTYDLVIKIDGKKEKEFPKTHVKCLYPANTAEAVNPLIKIEKKIKSLSLQPIIAPKDRYFIKNKSLFPLMKEKQVMFFHLLEGEVIRGIITDFSQYDITIHLKGGIPITILRHSIYDLRDKKGRCFLKSFQEKSKDWRKSDLYQD